MSSRRRVAAGIGAALILLGIGGAAFALPLGTDKPARPSAGTPEAKSPAGLFGASPPETADREAAIREGVDNPPAPDLSDGATIFDLENRTQNTQQRNFDLLRFIDPVERVESRQRPRGGPERGVGVEKLSAGDLVRMILNTPSDAGIDPAAVFGAGQLPSEQPNGGLGILRTIVEAAMDEETVAALTSVVRPNVSPNGLVTFSIGDFGNFALVASELLGGIHLIDIDRGRSIRIARLGHPDAEQRMPAGERRNRRVRGANGGSSRGGVMDRLLLTTISALREPLTYVVFLVFIGIAALWRMRSRDG